MFMSCSSKIEMSRRCDIARRDACVYIDIYTYAYTQTRLSQGWICKSNAELVGVGFPLGCVVIARTESSATATWTTSATTTLVTSTSCLIIIIIVRLIVVITVVIIIIVIIPVEKDLQASWFRSRKASFVMIAHAFQ